MMSEAGVDDVTVKGFDNPVFENDDKSAAGGTARLNVTQASNEELARQTANGAKKEHEAVNLELVALRPENGSGADGKAKDAVTPAEDGAFRTDEESGGAHLKNSRSEKYYPGGREATAKQRWLCWGAILGVIFVVIIVIILLSTGAFSGGEDKAVEDGSEEARVRPGTLAPPPLPPPTEPAPKEPPAPAIPLVDGVFSASLRLLEDFDPALDDRTSPQYGALEERVISEVTEAYSREKWPQGDEVGFSRVKVAGFSPGSVVVDLDIQAEHRTYVSPEEAADLLLRQLELYLSGAQSAQEPPSSRFPATDITVQPMEDLCASGQSGCSHDCQFDRVELEFVCTCPAGMEIGTDTFTCVFSEPEVVVNPIQPPTHGASLHPESTYDFEHEWQHEDGEPTLPTTTPEPLPQTTVYPDHGGVFLGDLDTHQMAQTTPQPYQTTAYPDSLWFEDLDTGDGTTPEPEPEPSTTAGPEPETTPEPEPETTPEPTTEEAPMAETDADLDVETYTVPEPVESTTRQPEPAIEEAIVPVKVAPGLDAAPVPAAFVRSTYNASLRLDEPFREELADNTSAEYLRMVVRVKKEMAEAFSSFNWPEGNDLGQIGIKIRKFEPGSVVVHFFVTTAGAATEDDAETTASRLQGRLSDYFTSEEGRRYHGARFPVAEVEVTALRDLCQTGESGCSHKCRFSSAEGQFRCHCPDGLQLAADLRTCTPPGGVSPEADHMDHDHMAPVSSEGPSETLDESFWNEAGVYTTASPETETEPATEPTAEEAAADDTQPSEAEPAATDSTILPGLTTPAPEELTTEEPEEAPTEAGDVTTEAPVDGAATTAAPGEEEAMVDVGEEVPTTTQASEDAVAEEGGTTVEAAEETDRRRQPGEELSLHEKLAQMQALGITPEWESDPGHSLIEPVTETADDATEATVDTAETATEPTETATEPTETATEPTETAPETTEAAAETMEAATDATATATDATGVTTVAPGTEEGEPELDIVGDAATPAAEPPADAEEASPTEEPVAEATTLATVVEPAPEMADHDTTENHLGEEPVNPPSLLDDEMHHGTVHEDAELLPVDNNLFNERRGAKELEQQQNGTDAAGADAEGEIAASEPLKEEAASSGEGQLTTTETPESTTAAAKSLAELLASRDTPTTEAPTKVGDGVAAILAALESAGAEAAGSTTEQSVEGPATEQSAEGPATEQSAEDPATEQSTADSTAEQSAETPTTEQSAADSTTEKSAEGPVTEQTTTGSTTEQIQDSPTTENNPDVPTTEQSTDSSIAEQSADEPTTEQTTDDSTTEQSTENSTTEQNTENPTTEQNATDSATEQSTAGPTTEQSAAGTTTEQSAEGPTTEQSTEGSTTEQSAEGPTTEQSAAGTTSEQSAAGTTTEQSAEGPTTEQSAAGPTTEQSAEGITTEQSAAGTTTEQSAAGTTTEQSAAGPTTEQNAEGPTTEQSAEGPTTEPGPAAAAAAGDGEAGVDVTTESAEAADSTSPAGEDATVAGAPEEGATSTEAPAAAATESSTVAPAELGDTTTVSESAEDVTATELSTDAATTEASTAAAAEEAAEPDPTSEPDAELDQESPAAEEVTPQRTTAQLLDEALKSASDLSNDLRR